VDISGCILTDDPTTNKFVIPSGTVIGPAGFIVFTQPEFGLLLMGPAKRFISSSLMAAGCWNAVQFGAQANGVSYGAGRTGRMIFMRSPPTPPAPTTVRL